jgi:hypothetical protein
MHYYARLRSVNEMKVKQNIAYDRQLSQHMPRQFGEGDIATLYRRKKYIIGTWNKQHDHLFKRKSHMKSAVTVLCPYARKSATMGRLLTLIQATCTHRHSFVQDIVTFLSEGNSQFCSIPHMGTVVKCWIRWYKHIVSFSLTAIDPNHSEWSLKGDSSIHNTLLDEGNSFSSATFFREYHITGWGQQSQFCYIHL